MYVLIIMFILSQMLVPSGISRNTRGLCEQHLLDLKHILHTDRGTNSVQYSRTGREGIKLLPMGTSHAAGSSSHVLLALYNMETAKRTVRNKR